MICHVLLIHHYVIHVQGCISSETARHPVLFRNVVTHKKMHTVFTVTSSILLVSVLNLNDVE